MGGARPDQRGGDGAGPDGGGDGAGLDGGGVDGAGLDWMGGAGPERHPPDQRIKDQETMIKDQGSRIKDRIKDQGCWPMDSNRAVAGTI